MRRESKVRETRVAVKTGEVIRKTRNTIRGRKKNQGVTLNRKERGERKRNSGCKRRGQREKRRGDHRSTKKLREVKKAWKIGSHKGRAELSLRKE